MPNLTEERPFVVLGLVAAALVITHKVLAKRRMERVPTYAEFVAHPEKYQHLYIPSQKN